MPVVLEYGKESYGAFDRVEANNKCTDKSPDSCWMAHLDQSDSIYLRVTDDTNLLVGKLKRCRTSQLPVAP